MSIELTEIINCAIRGPVSFLPKEKMLLDQDDNREQVVRCEDSTWRTKDGMFIVLPREAGGPRAVCRNFGCANNKWLSDPGYYR